MVAASAVVQLGWDVIVKPLDVSRSGHAPSHIPAAEVMRITLGQAFNRYWEMIGWFGWLDTPSPALVRVLWTLVLGSFVFVAVLWATGRQVAVLLTVVGAAVVVPVVIESANLCGCRRAHVAGALQLAVRRGGADPFGLRALVIRARSSACHPAARVWRRRAAPCRGGGRVRAEPAALHGRLLRRPPVLERPAVDTARPAAVDHDSVRHHGRGIPVLVARRRATGAARIRA